MYWLRDEALAKHNLQGNLDNSNCSGPSTKVLSYEKFEL